MKKETNFKAHTPYEPAGDQPQAIKEFQNLSGKQYLLNFIDKYLMNKTIALNGNN